MLLDDVMTATMHANFMHYSRTIAADKLISFALFQESASAQARAGSDGDRKAWPSR